jgi:hypothetical protein
LPSYAPRIGDHDPVSNSQPDHQRVEQVAPTIDAGTPARHRKRSAAADS